VAIIDEIRDPLVQKLCDGLVRAAGTVEDLVRLRSPTIVNVTTDALREVGLSRGVDVAPIRRGVGEILWELAWGKNLEADYARLSASDPKDLFRLDLVAEVSELGFRPAVAGERIVEEAANDLARLLWARVSTKVLVFGAERAKEPAASLDAITEGLASVIRARDPESDWLLVAFPNLAGLEFVPGLEWTVVSRVCRKGALDAPRERKVGVVS
jgi:hypothetical protein